VNRRERKYLACVCCALASIAGCAMLQNGESQLFSRPSRYESASILYRVGPRGPTVAATRVSLVSLQQQAGAEQSDADGSTGRRTTLAIRYPHPAGRAGYARVELIVETGPATPDPSSPNWLDRVRRLARENLPGIALAPGIDEALALDLPMAELDPLLVRLEQPAPATSPARASANVSLVASINGTALPLRNTPVAELDRLTARVRREGSLISHKAQVAEFPAAEPPLAARQPPSPQPASQIITASYTQPAIERLPPVGPPAR
jgi:hypothetical protein